MLSSYLVLVGLFLKFLALGGIAFIVLNLVCKLFTKKNLIDIAIAHSELNENAYDYEEDEF